MTATITPVEPSSETTTAATAPEVAPRAARAPGAPGAASTEEVRRRVVRLMLFRVVLITLVFGTTIALHRASPEELARPSAVLLFAIVAATYALTGVWAVLLRRVKDPIRFADLQIATDLVITSVLVHATGGAGSGYTFFYPLSIIGAALVRHRGGVFVVGAASVVLFGVVAIGGWYRWLPTPAEQRPLPWDLPFSALLQQLVLNAGAFAAVSVLAAFLGGQLAHAGERLERQRVDTADLAALTQDIVRCLSSGLLTVDRAGGVITVNEAAGEILGVPRDAPIGRPLAEVVPELAARLVGLELGASLRRVVLPIRVTGAPGGERTIGTSITPLTNHLGEAVGRVINLQDLTELRRMEAQVARAQRLASIGQLAAGIAHEIRNPLAAISGSIEMLRNAPQVLDEDNRALMDIVLREVDRLNGLISDLLAYARPRRPEPIRIDLRPLLAETITVFAKDPANARLRVRLAEPTDERDAVLEAVVDPDQLRQVVWNVLRNAAEAMPEGGEVTVAARRCPAAGEAAGSSSPIAGEAAEIVVSDAGVGVPAEDLDRIFDPFFTTKTRGSGLGLATVHRIVQDHGGAIAIESAPGRGTRVTVRLPLDGAPTAGAPEAPGRSQVV